MGSRAKVEGLHEVGEGRVYRTKRPPGTMVVLNAEE